MKINKITLAVLVAATALAITGCAGKNSKTMKNTTEWTRIAPEEIETNSIRLFNEQWFALAAGNEQDGLNLMTISWGTMGELWNKPVVTVYVAKTRHTLQYIESNDYFTLTRYPENMRDKLNYLGSVSGRDEDKVKGAELTVRYTELGNPIFEEANLAIECKKLYAQQLKPECFEAGALEWYTRMGLAPENYHMVFVGEIVNVWKK